MIKAPVLAVLAVGAALIAAVTISLWPRDEKVAYSDCTVKLLSKSPSPDGSRVVQYRRGVCDGGTIVLHTLEIARTGFTFGEKVSGVILMRTQSTDPSTRKEVLPLSFRWIDNDSLEVTYPPPVQLSDSLVINGVRVIGNPTR